MGQRQGILSGRGRGAAGPRRWPPAAAARAPRRSSGTPPTGSGGNEGGTLVGAYSAFPDYLDPALSHTIEGWTATYDTYIPLLTYAHANGKAGGKVIPGLATALPEGDATAARPTR